MYNRTLLRLFYSRVVIMKYFDSDVFKAFT